MICKECGTEAAIMKSGYAVSGDTSPEETTRVFSVLKFHCRNPQCRRFGEEIGEERHEVHTQ